ncbi:MAG: hypothetical protein ABI888_02820 [Chloroflexota bacterium]
MCRGYKPIEAFAFADMTKGTRQYNCRTCHAAYRRAHYLANKPDYIRRAIAQVRVRRAQNRREILAYLRSHPCVDCDERDILVLEFDHRDPKLKWKPIAVLAMTKRWQRVLTEIDKCDVRCVNCHRRRTAQQFGWAKALAV